MTDHLDTVGFKCEHIL